MEYKVRGISLLLFQKLFNTIERRGGARVVLLFGRIFSGCTPAFAEPYRIERTGTLWNRLSLQIFAAALAYCLCLTAALTLLNDTFEPLPGSSIELWEDKWNLFLYAVVCPMYVTLCIRLLLLAIERDEAPEIASFGCSPAVQRRRIFLSLFLITVLASILITGYVNDALDPAVVRRTYWFAEDIGSYRRLNSAGLFYIVLNFSLLFITFLGATAFISVSIDGIRLSRDLLARDASTDFKTYKHRLDRLVLAYFWGVLLVACYAVNIIVWKHSPLGSTANIHVAGAMLTLIGIFFVTIPRRFIEHAWSTYQAQRSRTLGETDPPEHQDVVPTEQSRVISIVQTLCIVGWLPNFYEIDSYTDPYRWFEWVFRIG